MIPVMKSQVVLFLIVCLFCACAAPGQVSVNTPQGGGQSYPPVVEDTPARQQAAEEAWKKFLEEFRLPEATPDREAALNTPRTLPTAFAGRIYLNSRGVAYDAMEAKNSLRRFLERARSVLGPDPNLAMKDLSLVSFSDDGTFYRATYRQASYAFPIANGYGELSLVVGKDSTLLQWGSRLIPFVELPVRAEIAPKSLVEKLMGREFTYFNIAGQPMRYRVEKREEISVKDLVVYPKITGKRMTIHLAYPIEVGRGMSWTVYIDAINGQELSVVQSFAT
jgi:hypothetical protein